MTQKLCRLLGSYATGLGEGVAVAVVDSGVDASHPAIASSRVTGVVVSQQGSKFRVSGYDGLDVAGHGTACAGRVLALAPRASIISCRVLNSTIQATSQALLVALDWVVREAREGRVHVVNLSLGTPNKLFGLDIAERVDALYSVGVPVVVARGYEDRPDYPSAFGSTISVVAERLVGDDEIVFRANDVVEFGVRGYDVTVPWLDHGWSAMSGSSVAAPLVAGRLARLKGLDPRARVWDLKSLLVEQAGQQGPHPQCPVALSTRAVPGEPAGR